MSVEQLIRESMSAFAETIEPSPASFERIAQRTRSGDRRISWLRYVPAVFAAATVVVVVAVQVIADRSPAVELVTGTSSPSPSLDASFTSPRGDWSFAYPKDWTLLQGNDSGWLVFNLAPERVDPVAPNIHELPRDGEMLIRFGITVPQTDQGTADASTQDIFDRVCTGPGPYPEASSAKFRLLDCKKTDINGRSWVVWLGALGEARVFEASAILDGKFYSANAILGPGDHQSDLLDVARRIFDTFEISPAV